MYLLLILFVSCFTFAVGYLLSFKRAKMKIKHLEEIKFQYEKLLIEKENRAKNEVAVKFLTGELFLTHVNNIEEADKNSSNLNNSE